MTGSALRYYCRTPDRLTRASPRGQAKAVANSTHMTNAQPAISRVATAMAKHTAHRSVATRAARTASPRASGAPRAIRLGPSHVSGWFQQNANNATTPTAGIPPAHSATTPDGRSRPARTPPVMPTIAAIKVTISSIITTPWPNRCLTQSTDGIVPGFQTTGQEFSCFLTNVSDKITLLDIRPILISGGA